MVRISLGVLNDDLKGINASWADRKDVDGQLQCWVLHNDWPERWCCWTVKPEGLDCGKWIHISPCWYASLSAFHKLWCGQCPRLWVTSVGPPGVRSSMKPATSSDFSCLKSDPGVLTDRTGEVPMGHFDVDLRAKVLFCSRTSILAGCKRGDKICKSLVLSRLHNEASDLCKDC